MDKRKQVKLPSSRKNASNNILRHESEAPNEARRHARTKKADKPNTRLRKRQKKDDILCKQAQEVEEEEDDSDVDNFFLNLPRLETRMSPGKVVKLIKELSDNQKESLAATPFRHMLNLEVRKLPTSLAYYIVSNYNFRDRKLRLDNGDYIDVLKKDVHTVLGLPIGGIIPNYSTNELKPFFEEWLDQFGDDVEGRLVTMSLLSDYILSHKEDGGPMFKRNILMFIITSLICSHGNQLVYIDAFSWVLDIEKSNELDWCELVDNSLLVTREKWSPGKQFRGPLLFLMLHFVDMVVDAKRDVPRFFPRLIGWTTKLFNKRQKKALERGGFGGGFLQKELPITSNVQRRKENGLSEAMRTRFTLQRVARVEETQKSGTSVIADALVPEKTKETHRASPSEAASQDEDHTGIFSEDDGIVQTVENVKKNTVDTSHIDDDYNGFTTFDDFISGIDELLQKDYTLPNHIKWSYYQLCSSQKAVLHVGLLKGVNPIMFAGCINEIVCIANEIKVCDLPTFDSNFAIWELRLKSLQVIGMNVGFLSARLLHLRRIVCNPETAKNRQRYMDLCSEHSDSEKTINRLEEELNEQRRVSEKIANDMKKLNADIEECKLKFQEQVSAPWCDPPLVL